MERNSTDHYYQVLADLYRIHNITEDTFEFFIKQRDEQNRFGKPMIWIGIYIAVASLFCILLMLADLLHGLKNRKLWFPCKYFTLNAASLTVIAVAMKLPLDLNNPMLGNADQAAKYVSMAFMCAMMANLLPSLASMDGKELLTNIIALVILVITMVVNVCIELKTGVLAHYKFSIATWNVVMLSLMLMIYLSSALTILKSKQILESKYQARHEKSLNELPVQQPERLMVEKLKQHVTNHWIMAGTGSPQLMVACFTTNTTAGVMCSITTLVHVSELISNRHYIWDFESDYQWSTSIILIIQLIGILIGTIAPLFRYTSPKFSRKWISSTCKVLYVESYCTQKLYDWKRSSTPLSFKSRRCKIVIHHLKALILNFCIGLQIAVVVACNFASMIPAHFVICVLYCWKWLKAMFSAFGFMLEKEPEQLEQNKDLSQYVLQLQDDLETSDRTLKIISNSLNHLIQKAKKQQPADLMKLLEGSGNFGGVGMYDMHQVPSIFADEYSECNTPTRRNHGVSQEKHNTTWKLCRTKLNA